MKAFRQLVCCSATIAAFALQLAPAGTEAAPSEKAKACLAQADLETVYASIPLGDQLYIKSVGRENQDYLAVLVGHGLIVHADHPPWTFYQPAFVLLDIQSCDIVHAFELQPRNQAGSEHFLVFNPPQDQIAIFSKWQNSIKSGDEIQRKQGAVAASYSYNSFALRTVTRYADAKYFPTERLLVDEAGVFGYFPCWYPELCKVRMRDLAIVGRYKVADESFDELGMQSDRSVKVHQFGENVREALGDSAEIPDGACISLRGVDESGQRRSVSFSPSGEPVYGVVNPIDGDSYFATIEQFEKVFRLNVTKLQLERVDESEQKGSGQVLFDDPNGSEDRQHVDENMRRQIEQVEVFPRFK